MGNGIKQSKAKSARAKKSTYILMISSSFLFFEFEIWNLEFGILNDMTATDFSGMISTQRVNYLHFIFYSMNFTVSTINIVQSPLALLFAISILL